MGKKYIGSHVSIAGGVFNAPKEAQTLNAKAFAMFTKNQKRWTAKPYDDKVIKNFKDEMDKVGIKPDMVLPHDSYLINLGHPELEKREKSLNAFVDEMERADKLGLTLLNFHPGSHLKKITEKECLNNIVESLDEVFKRVDNVKAVIETTAGQGSNVGYKFEHIAHIIDNVSDKNRVGVCIDTCHIFAAGYDLRTKKAYKEMWKQFEDQIDLKYLMGFHLNDSMKPFESKVDRHASLGEGEIGIDCFRWLMEDDRTDNIPLVLETPMKTKWAEEIAMLYSFAK